MACTRGGAVSGAGQPRINTERRAKRADIRAGYQTRSERLREDAALGVGLLDAAEADRVGSGAEVELALGGEVADLAVGALHALLELLLDLFQLPALGPLVLQPLVVRHHHAARVDQDVR